MTPSLPPNVLRLAKLARLVGSPAYRHTVARMLSWFGCSSHAVC